MSGTFNILALDIAFGPASACLLRRDGQVFFADGSEDRPHSQTIMPMLGSLLDEAAIDWRELHMLAAGVGPGSFTGLRIAAATLAGINSSLNLPLIELSSLAISALQSEVTGPIHVIEDARAGLAYYACYDGLREVRGDACLAWLDIRSQEPARYTAHQPDDRLEGWGFASPTLPRARAMAQLLADRSQRVGDTAGLPRVAQPAYLIPSQAERHARND